MMTKARSQAARRATAKAKSPAVEVKKERKHTPDEVGELSTGYKARFVPVASSLITEVTAKVENPPVPMFFIKEKDREEPNPNDPEYLRLLTLADQKRATATMDALVLFGVELVDGVPEGDEWVKKIKRMEKLGHLDLDGYNLEDEDDREFLFKRYVAVSADDLRIVMQRSGISEEQIALAAESFRGS